MDKQANKSTNKIINIVRRSLGYIDKRLIEHGERVAFIASAIADMDKSLPIDHERLFILALLHDIGAYKTEEIDNMVQFETNDVTNHALYGYVFLKNITFLGDSSEAILYHHTNFDKLKEIDSEYKTYAELIFLADRVDILFLHYGVEGLASLKEYAGTAFNPYFVELFFLAQEKHNITTPIADHSYEKIVLQKIDQMDLSQEQVMSFLRMLVYSIDFRSPFTVTHTANTTAISAFLAKAFDMTEEQTQTIRAAAFLHDIGKLAIPYSILESNSRLSDEQMAIMRTHAEVAEKILRGFVPDEICDIATRHHEKLNGSGYFRGLSEKDLSLSDRIVAVSDVISALINRRSYKQAFSKEKTLSIIEDMRDKGELCPKVVNMAISRFNEIIRLTNEADDSIIKLYETIQKEFETFSEA